MVATYLGLSGVAADSLEGGGPGRESRSPERRSQGGRTEAHGSRHCGGRGREGLIDRRKEENRRRLSGLKKAREKNARARKIRQSGWWTPEITDGELVGGAALTCTGTAARYQSHWPPGRSSTLCCYVHGGGSQLLEPSFKAHFSACNAQRVVFVVTDTRVP